jgi:hypothetical protein
MKVASGLRRRGDEHARHGGISAFELVKPKLGSGCFNAEVASALGLDCFENVRLHPVVMIDCAGERHEFHFRMRLLGSMMALDAFEVKAGVPKGYQFQILGEPEGEPLSLLARLVERMRRSLSVKYLVPSEHGAQIADQTVCGRIEWDESEDGRECLCLLSTVRKCHGTSSDAC